MQTLFVVKVSYFGLRQFTLNPTIWEGVRKAEEEAPEEEGDRKDHDDASDGDNVAEDPNHDDTPSDGEADICDIPDHDARDPAQAKWENHHRDPGQKAAKVPKQDQFPICQQMHQPERLLISSGPLRLPSKKNISSNNSFSPPEA